MNLKHLIQGYNFNKIPAKIDKEINQEGERAGVIKYNENIHGSYLLDDEGIVVAINIFSNCVVEKDKTMDNQLKHTTQTLLIIQKTMELLGNIKQEEANNIMKQLGMFSGNIKEKAGRFLNYVYKIDVANGLLMFTILEEAEEKDKTIGSGTIKNNKKFKSPPSNPVKNLS